jgi:MFS family permease
MTVTLATADLDPARRRIQRTLFAGVGLGSTGYIAASTVSAIVATELAGSSALAGVPAATVVLGSAFGSAVLSILMSRRGRRPGLVAGYIVGAVGALIAISAVLAGSFLLFLVGTMGIGLANSANQLSRYAGADMVSSDRRASAIGAIVWGGTIGAVLGPNLGTFAGKQLAAVGVPELVGVYLVPFLFVTAAAVLSFLLLRPDPSRLAWADEPGDAAGTIGGSPGAVPTVRELLRRPTVEMAIVALVVGQVVMVLIMTMTPVHMAEHGHDLEAIGLVISGHVFGMFALSPVSGRLTDRMGAVPVIYAGLAVMVVSAIIGAVAPEDGGPMLFLSLFLLGYGWNLGFVAGSSLLTSGLASPERTRIQGTADALIWCSAAAASLGSGVVQSVAGFTTLCLLGVGLAVVPALVLLLRRREASILAVPGSGS